MEHSFIELFSNPVLIQRIQEKETIYLFTKEEDISLKSLLLTSFLLTENEEAPHLYLDYIVKQIIEHRGQSCYDTVVFKIIEDMMQPTSDIETAFSIIKRFILNGYCYHSFNASFFNSIFQNGLVMQEKPWDQNKMEEVRNIFIKKGIHDVFGLYKPQKITPIFFANSLKSSSFYAYSSPTWFKHFTSGGMKNRSGMDKDAFFKRDYNSAYHNIELLCKEGNLNIDETNLVFSFFQEYWDKLATFELPMVAIIKRKSLKTEEKIVIAPVEGEEITDYIKRMIRIYGDQNHIVYHDIAKEELLFFSYDLKKNKEINVQKEKQK